MAYTAEERGRAIGQLRISAGRTSDGIPNWSRVSRETGVSRATLQAWWRDAGGEATPAPLREAGGAPHRRGGAVPLGPVPDGGDTAWACEQLGVDDPADRSVKLVAELRAERNMCGAETARTAATKLLVQTIADLKVVRQARSGPNTPEEWKDLMRALPDLVVEVVMETPAIRDDPRLRGVA